MDSAFHRHPYSKYSGKIILTSELITDPCNVRIVHISDTHNHHWDYVDRIIDGDILVHSGDFSKRLRSKQFEEALMDFNEFLGVLPHRHKIFVAGNHEIAFNQYSTAEIQALLPNCIYLQDSGIELEGLRFFGSPWTSSKNMGFSCSKKRISQKWDLIPENTDILITHMPPFNILDLAYSKRVSFQSCCKVCGKKHPHHSHWGNESLLNRIRDIGVSAHLFGHVHNDTGFAVDGNTLFQNAAMDLSRTPYYFDVEIFPMEAV